MSTLKNFRVKLVLEKLFCYERTGFKSFGGDKTIKDKDKKSERFMK